MSTYSIETDCTHCDHVFEVDRELAGSIQNCPACGRATEIGGENDPLWTFVSFSARGAACVGAIWVYYAFGPVPGVLAMLGAGALLLILRASL